VDRDRELLRHFLGAIAYRAQKALRDAPAHYPTFSAGHRARTPLDIVRHMASLMGYVTTHFVGGTYPVNPEPLPTFVAEVARFHENLQKVGALLESDAPLRDITLEQLLQGPLADTMTHVGQLAMLRRLADSPVPPENFIYADIRADRLDANQPPPARPDQHWPEAPDSGRGQ
jgi:hypothetical protein